METSGRRVFPHPDFGFKEKPCMDVGATRLFEATVIADEGAPVEYKSDDPDILAIDDKGNVTALKEGYGEVLAYADGKMARLGIDVVSIPRGIKGFIAHRGIRELAPENTIEAFKLALEKKFDYVETDLQVTKDKQLVIMHDKTLKRMMGLQDMRVCDYTVEELQALPFTGGNHLEDYPDVRVPTFEEYLALVASSETKPMIELKDETFCNENKDMLKEVKKLLDQYDLASKARITSATRANILAYEEINEKSELGYIVEEGDFRDINFMKEHHFMLCWKYKDADYDFLKVLHDEGIVVDLWVINDKRIAKKLLDWPITSMTSDLIIFTE